jgi:hypothetical protein
MKILVALLCSWLLMPIQQRSSGAKKPLRISDSYARAAILAINAIRRDMSTAEERNAEVVADKHTIDAIDTADAEARTSSEEFITGELNRLFSARLVHNSRRQFIELNYYLKLHNANELIQKMNIDEAMAKDPEIADLKHRESECFDAFEESIRARLTAVPATCSDEALKAKPSSSQFPAGTPP